MENYVGKKLDGRYELQEIIGVGGMAVVYKAYDNIEARIVAVKILKDEYISNEEFVRRFKNESKAIAVLSHPNIVKVFDVSISETIQYIVMEYIDGITLKQLIEQQGSLRWKDALYYAVQILRGLQHAHDKGIVHRDVKPQNIIVLPDGTIKVTDFGIARFARSEQKTITDKAIGSVHYISPEQARGDNTDEKSDIYSLGVILYEMLTGQLPFQADSAVSVAIMQLQREPELPTSINGSIPEGIEQITLRAMQKNAEKRYKTASEMLCDLEAFKRDPAATFDYVYYVDEQPTKYIETVKEEKNNKKVTVVNSGSVPWLPVIAGITVTFVATLVILLAIYIPKFIGKTEDYDCPDFVGLQWEDVQAEHGKIFDLIPDYESSDRPIGEVIAQSETKGRDIKAGHKITLTVSSGPKTVAIPDVSGLSYDIAKERLVSAGFDPNKIKSVETTDNEIEADLVVRTTPEINTPTPLNSEITVYVSVGKATRKINMPDLIGMSEKKAVELLESKGLVVGSITSADNTDKYFESGTVMAQTPESGDGAKVGVGSAVDLVISTGYYKSTIKVNVSSVTSSKGLKTGYISIWQNDVCLAISTVIDFEKTSEYNLTFNSTSQIIQNCKIKIGADDKTFNDFLNISNYNCTTGQYNVS